MTDTHEKFMEQARQVTKTILRMDPCYPEQFEMRDIIAAALVAAHQDGIREGKRQAAEIVRAYPPDAFFTALNGATDGVGPVHEFRGFDGDAGNWAYLMSVILEPYALAILSTITDESE